MQLLNGYYISKPQTTCLYCDNYCEGTCSRTCTSESLKNENMKVLTSNTKEMIDEAVWYTYAVKDAILSSDIY